jgi:glycosyltransferase involved in cell wall biosynthesis
MTGRRILFVHDNFPGQFGALAIHLRDRGWQVAFACKPSQRSLPGVRILTYRPHRAPRPETHPYAQAMDRAAITAQAFVRTALEARAQGYRPDLVVAHSGWGAGMFARDVFPEAGFIAYCEWWYRHPGADTAFLAALEAREPGTSVEAAILERARNAPIALDLASADAALCPTEFQARQFPDHLRRGLTLGHDGVDTDRFRPAPAHFDRSLGGLVPEDAPIVTYATRGMEPHRGFPQVMAALPQVLAENPKAIVLIAGENRVAYGGDAIRRVDWKARALAEHGLDPARVRFLGRLDPARYLALLQRSDAHVYLTVPFVLSWSMLEAMSVGAPMVLSDTEPVREFAGAQESWLVDFTAASIAQGISAALADRDGDRRKAARDRVLAAAAQSRTLPAREALFLSRMPS